MKCPHCGEDLGINNICINPTCSYFGSEVNSSLSNDNINTNDSYTNTTNQNYNILNENLNDSNTNIDSSSKSNSQPNYDSQANMNNPINYSSTQSNNTYNQNYNNTEYNQSSKSNDNTNNKSNKNCHVNDISDEEFLAFFGHKNSEFYLRQTNTYRVNSKFTNWNWSSFFLTFYWLLYRKLYGVAFGYFAINIVGHFLGPVSLIMRIILGFYGNNIYLKAAEKKIRGIRRLNHNLSREEYLVKIREQGGTNIIAPLAFLFVFFAIIIIAIIVGIFAFSSPPKIHHSGYYYY